MDPPAWKKNVRYVEEEDEDRPIHSSHQPDVRSEVPSVSAAALQAAGQRRDRRESNDTSRQEESIGVPHFKDQARPAALKLEEEYAMAQQGGSTIPLAESVYIIVEDEVPADPPTLPAVALPAAPAGINAKNTLGTVERPAVTPVASGTKQDNSGNGNNNSTSVPMEAPHVPPNTSNVSEDILEEDSEDGQILEDPDWAISSKKPNSTPAKSPHAPPKKVVNRQLAMHTSNKPKSTPTKSRHTPPKAAVNRQPRMHRKCKIWAGSLVLLVVVVLIVVVAAVLIKTSGVETELPNEELKLPTKEIKLLASDGAASDRFGFRVAIAGDTIVIGATEFSKLDGSAGRAYVYTHSGTVWTEQIKLTASDGAKDDNFGYSVAIDSDTIVIGAKDDDTDNGIDSGSAYVYTLSGSVWTEQAKLMANDGIPGDQFGRSVAINGEYIVIGAYNDSTENGGNSGSAYVYTRSGAVWTEQAKVKASDGAEGDEFGWSVAIDRDTIVIGAQSDESSIDSGSAYVYTRAGTVWTEQIKLTASDGTAGDEFGDSVAISGGTVVIGADTDDTENGAGSGSAYVYTHSGSVWTEQAKLTASDGAPEDQFGSYVAIDGDTIVTGADKDDIENGDGKGSAYVYTRSGTVWTEQMKLTASDGADRDFFGISVAIDGGTIVIGAYYDDTENGENSGSTYIFE